MSKILDTIDPIYLNLDNYNIIPNFNNRYLISKYGLIYDNVNKIYRQNKSKSTKKGLEYFIRLINENEKEVQYNLRDLLYLTYIDKNYNLTDTLGDFIKIKKTINPINTLFINYTIEDLYIISRSENNKQQARNNRLVNMYDTDYQLIKQFKKIIDTREYFNICDHKPIREHVNKKSNVPYRKKYYFRYDDDDNIKNPNIINKEKIKDYNELTDSELLNEIWHQLEDNDFYKKYEISNYGRFRKFKTKKILSQDLASNYLYCCISMYENGIKIKKRERTNRLVATYFVAIDKEKYKNLNKNDLVSDHIDNNKLNNKHYNLQWLSNSENVIKGLVDKNMKDLNKLNLSS